MNRIYKIVWNAARGCYVVASEIARTHQGKKSLKAGVLAAFAMAAAGGAVAHAAVTVADQAYSGSVVETAIAGTDGKKYEIANQQVSGDKALNRFRDFSLNQADIANLNLGKVDHQINVVNNKIEINGVVNALKDGQIGGDVYFFSNKGIAVGANGVINVGRLTLGTNATMGEAIFGDAGFFSLPLAGQAAKLKGDAKNGAPISIAGQINAQDSILISTEKDVTLESTALLRTGTAFNVPSYATADAYRESIVNTAGIQRATTATATDEGIVLSAGGDITMIGGEVESHGRRIVMEANNDLTLTKGKILSDGGAIGISVKNSIDDRKADPEAPENGGMLIIKASNISSKTADGKGGDIELTALRDAMGVARVTIDDSTIDAGTTGDVAIHATANTTLYAWDIGDGAYAQIRMGKESQKENTITGKNVEIAARASTTGEVGEADETAAEKDLPEITEKGGIWETVDDFVGSAMGTSGSGTEALTNVRLLGSATKIAAAADVDVENTKVEAVGTGEADGDIRISSDARSAVTPITSGILGLGFNVGISHVDSHVRVDNSTLDAEKDVEISATGSNKVALTLMKDALFSTEAASASLNFSWAELHSDVSAKVGEGATISSKGNMEISATSTRELSSEVASGGSMLALAGAVGIADTKAEAEMAGTVNADGDVSVKAENAIDKTGNLYSPDTVSVEGNSGDSGNRKFVSLAKGGPATLTKLKNSFATGTMNTSILSDLTKKTGAVGVNAATGLLFSKNDAKASVTGTVGGKTKTEGAKSVTVDATTISRTSNVATTTAGSKSILGTDGTKVAMSAAVSYTQQENHAEAFISGNVKSAGDVDVKAETKIPYQNLLTAGAKSDAVLDRLQYAFGIANLKISDLVDSWTEASGTSKLASGAASVSVVNYDNSATAYIGKKDETQTAAPQVVAGGDVNVDAKTDITTVNFAGSVADSFVGSALEKFVRPYAGKILAADGKSGASKAGLGGAALAVIQKNTTDAHIDGGAEVHAGEDVSVDAKTEAVNIALSTAGGKANTVAIDATVGVNRIDDTTKAYTDGKVTADGDAAVSAEDASIDVNLAGSFARSQNASIGASVAYNQINRDTEAMVNGTLEAGGQAAVTAQNSGEILAASVAGALVSNGAGSTTNGAGSSGISSGSTSTGSTSGDSGAAPAENLEGLVDTMAGENTNMSSNADKTISGVASQASSMKDNAGNAKGGLAAAANVSVNRIGDTAKAGIGNAEGSLASVTADALKVTSANDSAIKAISGAVSLNLKAQQGTSIAGSFMYNDITGKNEAYVENANLTLTGNDDEEIDESLTVSATNQEEILNVAASGSGASKGTAVAGQISVNQVKDTTVARVTDSTVKADEAVRVIATDEGKIDSYTGAVSFAGAQGNAVGTAIAVNLIEGDTDANMEGSVVQGTGASSGGSVVVAAEEGSEITSFVAAGAAGTGNIAAGFSSTGNYISTSTDAHVDNGAMDVKSLTVDAGNHSSATLGVGSVAIAKSAAGAAIAVMVNDSDVTAYAKSTDATAGALTISADNAYNGSAVDPDEEAAKVTGSDEAKKKAREEAEENTAAKTVAVGVAGGTGQFAGSGSVTVNVISQDTDAYLGAGTYDIQNGDVTIDAKSTAKLFGLAGGVALSRGAGVGAAVDVQKYTGHTYGYIGDGVKLTDAGKVDVQATSAEKLTSIAATVAGGAEFAGAGAAGAHDITTDTKAFIGKEDSSSSTTVEAAKNVSIYAEDTTKLITSAGAGGGGGTAGVGLTAAVEVVDKTVAAFVGDGVKVTGASGKEGVDSFSVKATNTSDSKTFADGLAAGGTAGVAGAASETFVTHETDAYVGKNATVKATKGATITADSSLTQTAQSGSVAGGGTVGMGLGNATVSFKGRTHAYTDKGATVDGGSKVAVDASHATDLTYATVAGAASGTASVNGTVGVNVLDTETKAYISEDGKVSADSAATNSDGISVNAKDTTKLYGGNGGTAIGAGGAGVGAAVGVANIKKDTEAYVGNYATLETTGETNIKAENAEDLTNFTIQASGGLGAGLAGAVNVTNLSATTKAYTGTGVKMNQSKVGQSDLASGDVNVVASHLITNMSSIVAGAAAAAGSVGTAVDVGVVRTQTQAYLGDSNKVYTTGNAAVVAQDNMTGISTTALAASFGGMGISGSVSVYDFGSQRSDSDKDLLTGTTDKEGTTSDVDTWANGQVNGSKVSTALEAYQAKSDEEGNTAPDAMENIRAKAKTTFASETPDMGEKGTLAQVGSNTSVTAKSVGITASDQISVTNDTANISGSTTASVGATVSVVNADTLTQAKTGNNSTITTTGGVGMSASSTHTMNSTIAGASISGGHSLQGTEETWNDKSDVKTIIGKASHITAGGPVNIASVNTRSFESSLTGASVGISGALNGALITSKITGTSEILADEGADVKSTGDTLMLRADADTTLSAKAIGAAVGTYAGTGTGVVFESDVTAKTTVGKKAKLSSKGLLVSATNTPTLKAEATSAGLGLAGVGITKSYVKSTDKALTTVEDDATLTSDGSTMAVYATMDTPRNKSDYNVYASATAGAGGVISGAVALSEVDMDQETKVDIGKATIEVKGGSVTIDAHHEDTVNTKINSVSAGYYSGTGGETKTNITSDVSTTIGAAKITADEIGILSRNETARNKSGAKTAESVGASVVGGNGVVNDTNIIHNTKVDIGAATITAKGFKLTDAEIAAGKTLYDKNAITIESRSDIVSKDDSSLATGAVVSAAHVKNTHKATATTTTTVGKATLLAGDTDGYGTQTENAVVGDDEIVHERTIRGGSIAVTASNDADVESTTLVDVYGAAGYAGSENNVTYENHTAATFGGSAETAKGDVRVAAGRGNDGTKGTITVVAKSDILNATAFPISVKKDPVATIQGDAKLAFSGGSSIKSDRDVLLQSTVGEMSARGYGEVKDWVNTVAEAFGSEGSSIGKSVTNAKASATLDGTAETGIHRNKEIIIGGTNGSGNQSGKWTTNVTTTGDISYTLGKEVPAGAELSQRLKDLKELLAEHISDPAAKAAYEAEIAFVEAKMVEQGLGYMNGDQFVEVDPSEQSELAEAKTRLAALQGGMYDKLVENIKADQAAVQENMTQLEDLKTSYNGWQEKKVISDRDKTARDEAQKASDDALDVLKKKIGGNPTASEVQTYIQEHSNSEVTKYTDAQAALGTAQSTYDTSSAATGEALTAYVNAVKAANYDIADDGTMTEATKKKIKSDYEGLDAADKNYTTLIRTAEKNYETLEKQVEATNAFFDAGGTESGGKFYKKDKSEVVDGVYNGQSLLHKESYAYTTHDVTIGDIKAQLGDIYLEGDTVEGSGTLTAHGDANVTIKNMSPNNLIVGDIRVEKDRTNGFIDGGGNFYLNGSVMKSGTTLGSLTLKDGNSTAAPSVQISSTFSPRDPSYVVKNGDETVPLFAAPSLTIQSGKTIYNPQGLVSVVSDYGDLYNNGSIVAGSVEMTAKNGDFIQSYSNRIANIGGEPFVKGTDGYVANSNLGSGILANGNIFISARYVNINSKIQSGVASYQFEIPKTPTFYYRNKDGDYVKCKADTENVGTIYVGNDKGIISDTITYDQESGNVVVSGLEVRGGKVSIVGTIVNTNSDTNAARIEALDGFGSINIKNNSSYNLELKGVNTGSGVEGVIEITDLDTKTGNPKTKTTYTRKNGTIYAAVQTYSGGKWTNASSSAVGATTTYTPQADQHYVFQTGTSKKVTSTYEYHGTKFDWWGIEHKTPTRDELIAMGAELTSTLTGNEEPLLNGSFISGSKAADAGTTNAIGDGQTKTWTVTNDSVVQEYTIKTKRQWYTFGLTKKYDMKMVIRDENTEFKQYEMDASHPIGIGFNGSESGGTVTINQASGGNVYIAGGITNKSGATTITGGSITQSNVGTIDTKSLTLTATKGGVGDSVNAIRTTATSVSGSATGGDFLIQSSNALEAGDITSGGIVSLTADGDISQKANTTVTANRVELTSAGAIHGATNSSAFTVKTGAKAEKGYGLKAAAEKDISITNTGGDLYLDSVISKNGTVTLSTNGSFVDNNYTDLNNESANAKLLAWTKAAVLEGKDETTAKQKDRLIAKVESKYGEFQALKDYVDADGVYTLDDSTKATLTGQGINVDTYIATKQARYNELKETVGKWTKSEVESYVKSIEADTSSLYSNASVTKADLTADKFLTQDEKAEVLVGSAKSAKDLLVTFAPGSIKEGITDTKTTLKGTPHVSGTSISLTSTNKDIGQKTTGMKINLDTTNLSNLTHDQLLALASAERGDFKLDGNTVTVSAVRPITAETSGTLTAIASQGAIYLISEGGITSGSTFTAGGEVRLKTSGTLDGITIGTSNGANLILESGSGAITNTTITGTGVLTARAKDGVDIKKSDSDLIVNTIYASDGDVIIDLKGTNGNNSLLAEEREAGEETSYINIQGENVTITNAKDMKGEDDTTTLGLYARGYTTGDIDEVDGVLQATGTGDANISLFGNNSSAKTAIEAENLTLTNTQLIGNGTYTAKSDLKVNNLGTINGGTFKGKNTALVNNSLVKKSGKDEAGKTIDLIFNATEKLTVQNNSPAEDSERTSNDIKGAVLEGKDVAILNAKGGVMEGNEFIAKEELSINNSGNMNNGLYGGQTIVIDNYDDLVDGAFDTDRSLIIRNHTGGTLTDGTYRGGTLTLENDSAISGGTYTGVGDLKVTNAADATIGGGTYSSTFGNVTIGGGSIEGGTYTAKLDLNYTGGKSVEDAIFLAETGSVTVTSAGKIDLAKAKARGNLTVTGTGTDTIVLDEAESEIGSATITAEKAGIIIGSLRTAKDSIVKANGEGLTATLIDAGAKADLYAKGAMTVTTLTAGTDANAEAGGNISITSGTAKNDLTITSTGGSIEGTTLEATGGDAIITAAKDVTIHESLTSGKDIEVRATDGNITANVIDAGEKASIYAGGSLNLNNLNAGTDIDITVDGDINLTNGKAKNDVKLTSTGGSIESTTLEATEGEAVLTAAKNVTIHESLKSGTNSTVKANGEGLTAKLVGAGAKADLYAKGVMTVTTLKAGTDAKAVAGGNMSITTGTAEGDLILDSIKGSITATTLEATNGGAEITAAKDMTIEESLRSRKSSIVKALDGDLTAPLVDAGTYIFLYAKDQIQATTLKAGANINGFAYGDITVTTGTAGNGLTLTSYEGSVTGTNLAAIKDEAVLEAAKNVTIEESLTSGKRSIVKALDGDLTAKLVGAGTEADLYAKGHMTVETLKAGTDAEAEADGNITITTAAAANDLTITSHEGNIVGTTLTATGGSATLKADKGTMNITKLTAGKDAKAEGYGDITIDESTAGENLTVLSHNGSVNLTTAEATKGNADITAGQSVTIADLTAGAHTTVKANGGTLTANSIKANESATLYSKGFMDIENLETIRGNANLTTDDSMDVTNAQIGDVLTMKAAKNITVSQSNSVNKTIMEAGDTIQTKGENANISSDEIEMTAGESILITDRSPVEKFTGVDLGEAAAVTTGSGDAGSLLNGEATGHDYDVTKKGSATLTARKGKADLTAKRLEVDTAIIGTEGTASPATLTMEVDNAAIDDLQSAADTLHVMIHGNTSENTHYAGLHNSTDGSAIVKDSHIDHLNFTGNNDIGTENSTFAGDSLIQTEKVLVSLWKNPGNTTAESIGKIFIHDYDIASSEYFTRIRNGLTVNGERFPYTADSVMNKSLYGDNYLGKDGREKEEENTFYARELRFGEVTDKEAYRVVE